MTGRKSGSHVPERMSRKAEPTARAVNTVSAPRSDRFERSRWRQATAAKPTTTITEAPPTDVATRAAPMCCHSHTQFALERCGARSAAENATRAKTAMTRAASLTGQRSSVLTTRHSPAPAVPPASAPIKQHLLAIDDPQRRWSLTFPFGAASPLDAQRGAPAPAAICPAGCDMPSGRTAGSRSVARTGPRTASRHTPPAAPDRSRHRSRRRRRPLRSDQSTCG
jgi:hypothetical protein